MAHFAKIEEGIVTQVIVIDNSVEDKGQEFINNELKLDGTWIQTSYNTIAGKHRDGGIPLRKNYAGIGYTYDSELDAFIPPKPFESWVIDEETGTWQPPIPYPNDEQVYNWDEEATSWKVVEGK